MTRTLVAFSLLERWILTAPLDLDACARASCDTRYNLRTISAAQPAVLHSIPISDVCGQGEMRPCARALKRKAIYLTHSCSIPSMASGALWRLPGVNVRRTS